MSRKKICVIGAGASGLTAIKSCKEEGFDVTCFEKDDDIGGLWRYHDSDDDGKPSVMKSTIINTSKEMNTFSDFPPPEHFPNFMHNSLIMEYLEMYASNFDLRQHIIFRQEVANVEKSEDYKDTGRWLVTLKDLVTSTTKHEIFDGIMVCTGHHVYPNIPTFKGLQDFHGKVLHTHSLKSAKGFEDQTVLVIGIGNSAVDAAVEIGHIAKKVYLSTRKGSWISPRVGVSGRPIDTILLRRIFMFMKEWCPFSGVDRVAEFYLNFLFDHETYRLRPQHHLFSAHPTINNNLPNSIISGKVVVKQDIEKFQKSGVVFQEEESVVEIDAVVLATGYQIKYPFLDNSIIKIKDNNLKLYKLMFSPNLSHPTLAFIGLIQPLGSIFPISEAQSRWFSFLLSNNLALPPKEVMDKEIESRITKLQKTFVPSPRHTVQVHYIDYMDEICSEFGAKPNLFWMVLTDPLLFSVCCFGPCTPYQYRIQGPHSWSGARSTILSVNKRIDSALNTCPKR